MNQLIALHGASGAGKDHTFHRMQLLYPERIFKQYRFTDPLKDLLCAAMNMDRDEMDLFQRDPSQRMMWCRVDDDRELWNTFGPYTNMRQAQVAFGAAMRELFGEQWAVRKLMERVNLDQLNHPEQTPVITDLRLPAEAYIARKVMLGKIWHIIGPDEVGPKSGTPKDEAIIDETERPLGDADVDYFIDNSCREDDNLSLDFQIREILG